MRAFASTCIMHSCKSVLWITRYRHRPDGDKQDIIAETGKVHYKMLMLSDIVIAYKASIYEIEL